MGITDKELAKWSKYFRYFYFNDEMTFEEFMNLVRAGKTPKRNIVDWSRVKFVAD